MDWLSHFLQINWLAVLLSFAANLVIGFVWYMPAVLGRRWMAAIGKTEQDLKSMDGGAALWMPMLLASAATSIMLAVLVSSLSLDNALSGGVFGLTMGLVFRSGGHVIHNGFAGRPSALTVIDAGHDVVAMTASGLILGALQ